jgi:hypothetical protein
MHEVVRAKSKLILHIVGEAVGLLGQHLLAMLGDNLNVPLRRMAISL